MLKAILMFTLLAGSTVLAFSEDDINYWGYSLGSINDVKTAYQNCPTPANDDQKAYVACLKTIIDDFDNGDKFNWQSFSWEKGSGLIIRIKSKIAVFQTSINKSAWTYVKGALQPSAYNKAQYEKFYDTVMKWLKEAGWND